MKARQKLITPRQKLIPPRQKLISPRQNLISPRQKLIPLRHGLRACVRSDSLCPGCKGTFNTTHIRKPKGVTRCRFHVVAVIQGGMLYLALNPALNIDFD